MHYVFPGWHRLVRPAIATSLCWVGLAVFSSLYFSSAIRSEQRLFGEVGVIFILLIWFIAVGAVIVLGAACGAVWQDRKDRTT